MNDCSFCRIIARHVPGYILHETDLIITFLSLENHPLVVPKQHIADIYHCDEVTGHAIMSELITIANAVKHGIACEGVYITQANEPAAGQDVFHLHFHVYPRWHNIPHQTTRVHDTARAALYERLKKAVDSTESVDRPIEYQWAYGMDHQNVIFTRQRTIVKRHTIRSHAQQEESEG